MPELLPDYAPSVDATYATMAAEHCDLARDLKKVGDIVVRLADAQDVPGRTCR